MSNEEVSNEGQNSNTNIEMNSIGINTDTLPEEELRKLVENNKELQDEQDVSNILHEVKDNTINVNNNSNNNELSHINAQIKKDLIDELNEKDKIFNLLVKSNAELKSKIEISTEKYNEILKKINEKQNEKNESKLTLQIKEMEKEINANNAETEHYKRQIDTLKNKIEFKTNLERAFNLQSILKAESMKNAELKNQLKSLERVNGVQIKYINNYDKENRISEKLDILKSEIKQTKDSIKDYQEKFAKQDRFIRLVHEKILSLEMIIKKMKEPKVEKTKLFTREELKKTLDEISNIKDKDGNTKKVTNNQTINCNFNKFSYENFQKYMKYLIKFYTFRDNFEYLFSILDNKGKIMTDELAICINKLNRSLNEQNYGYLITKKFNELLDTTQIFLTKEEYYIMYLRSLSM